MQTDGLTGACLWQGTVQQWLISVGRGPLDHSHNTRTYTLILTLTLTLTNHHSKLTPSLFQSPRCAGKH